MLSFSLIYVVSSLFLFYYHGNGLLNGPIVMSDFVSILFLSIKMVFIYIGYTFFITLYLSWYSCAIHTFNTRDINGMSIKQTHINQIEICSLLLFDTLSKWFSIFIRLTFCLSRYRGGYVDFSDMWNRYIFVIEKRYKNQFKYILYTGNTLWYYVWIIFQFISIDDSICI